jgi:UDP-2-acetamido-3-amino-2,3-dideoxy-glucuronate N-acetyltransferase
MPRIALVGAGYWGKNYLRVLSELEVLAGVVETDQNLSNSIREQYQCRVDTLEALLKDDSIDAFVIATPAATHFEVARAVILAGKDVLIEKPLAVTLEDGRRLVEMATDLGIVLMVGHLLRYHPAYVAMKELIAGGRIGHLQYCYSNRLNLGKIRREENVLWSFAPHDISMILDLIGEHPSKVWSHGDFILGTNVADSSLTHLTFPGGARAHIFVSWLHPTKVQQLVAIGDDGMLVFDDTLDWSDKLKHYPHHVEIAGAGIDVKRASPTLIHVEASEPLTNQVTHFVECCQTRFTPVTSGSEGLAVLSVLDKATRQIVD